MSEAAVAEVEVSSVPEASGVTLPAWFRLRREKGGFQREHGSGSGSGSTAVLRRGVA